MDNNHAHDFNLLKRIHNTRVERAERAMFKRREEHEESLKEKDNILKALELEKHSFVRMQNDMDAFFTNNLVTRLDIEAWRSRLAKQKHAISVAESKVKEADIVVQEKFIALRDAREAYKSILKKKDKIYEISDIVTLEFKKAKDKKEERELEDR